MYKWVTQKNLFSYHRATTPICSVSETPHYDAPMASHTRDQAARQSALQRSGRQGETTQPIAAGPDPLLKPGEEEDHRRNFFQLRFLITVLSTHILKYW